MKKQLLGELKINTARKIKIKEIKKYLSTLEALGLATLIGLTRLSTNKILKNKKWRIIKIN